MYTYIQCTYVYMFIYKYCINVYKCVFCAYVCMFMYIYYSDLNLM